MNDLFKKLNMLVKSSINDVFGEGAALRRPVDRRRLGKDLDREVSALRERINEAIAHEDDLKVRVQTLRNEVGTLDQQADAAIKQGDDALARHLIGRMQTAKQRLAIAESDLREHELVTQDLIQRVNLLDAVIAESRRPQPADAGSEAADSAKQTPGRRLSDSLRDVRLRFTQMSATQAVETEAPASPAVNDQVDAEAVEDDLAARRQRLSRSD